jgi:hypothetical protein
MGDTYIVFTELDYQALFNGIEGIKRSCGSFSDYIAENEFGLDEVQEFCARTRQKAEKIIEFMQYHAFAEEEGDNA